MIQLDNKHLKKIVRGIEKYASVTKVEILNSETSISIPNDNKTIVIDLNKPQTYCVTFLLGNEIERRDIEGKKLGEK